MSILECKSDPAARYPKSLAFLPCNAILSAMKVVASSFGRNLYMLGDQLIHCAYCTFEPLDANHIGTFIQQLQPLNEGSP